MLTKLSGNYRFILENDPAVDHDNWEDIAKKKYFVDDFHTPPPLKPGESATVFVLQPLRGKAMRAAVEQMDAFEDIVHAFESHAFTEFVCAHGIQSIENFGDLSIVIEDGPYGPRLDQDTMDDIFPFVPGLDALLAGTLMSLSRLRFT